MVIVLPYRPKRRSPEQIQPTEVFGTIGSMTSDGINAEVTTPGPPTGNRTLIYEGDFPSNWRNIHPWVFTYGFNSSIDESYTTMNGHDAVQLTFDAGSNANVRFGGDMHLSRSPVNLTEGLPEGWLSFDTMLLSPFSIPTLMKHPGVRSYFRNNPHTLQCDDGLIYLMEPCRSGAPSFNSDVTTNEKRSYTTLYSANQIGSESLASGTIGFNVVIRVEMYWKLNTSASQSNGILELRWDNGTASTHATPTTLRQRFSNVLMYCGSESFRAGAGVGEISYGTFWGGPVAPGWAPTIDSTFRYGYFKIEVPA